MIEKVSPETMCQIKSAGYRPPQGYRPMFVTMGLPPFTLNTVEWMMRDPQIKLCMNIKKAPYHKIILKINGQPEVAMSVARQVQRFWARAIYKVTDAFWYTQCAAEVVYKYNQTKGIYDFEELREFYPQDINILHRFNEPLGISLRPNGFYSQDPLSQFMGTIGDRPNLPTSNIHLWFPKAFLYIHNRKFNSLNGRSEFEAAYPPWLEKNDWQGSLASRKLWFYKNVFNGGIMFHPPGNYTDPSNSNLQIPYADLARQSMEAAINGAVWTIAQQYDPVTKQPLWNYVEPKVNPGGAELINYNKTLDIEMAHGIGIPDDVIQQVSESGSRAGRSVPLMAFFVAEDENLDRMFEVCDKQVFRPLARLNHSSDDYEASVDVDVDRLMGTVMNEENAQPGLPNQPEGPMQAPIRQMSQTERRARSLVAPSVRCLINGEFVDPFSFEQGSSKTIVSMSFDPNQPRDDEGKWVKGSVSHINKELDRLKKNFPALSKLPPVETTVHENELPIIQSIGETADGTEQGRYLHRQNKINLIDLPEGPTEITLGKSHVGNSFSDLFRHELGHHVHDHHREHIGVPTTEEGNRLSWQRDVAPEFVGKDKKSILSDYAKINHKELFAEAFSVYTHPKYKRGILPHKIEHYFDCMLSDTKQMSFDPDQPRDDQGRWTINHAKVSKANSILTSHGLKPFTVKNGSLHDPNGEAYDEERGEAWFNEDFDAIAESHKEVSQARKILQKYGLPTDHVGIIQDDSGTFKPNIDIDDLFLTDQHVNQVNRMLLRNGIEGQAKLTHNNGWQSSIDPDDLETSLKNLKQINKKLMSINVSPITATAKNGELKFSHDMDDVDNSLKDLNKVNQRLSKKGFQATSKISLGKDGTIDDSKIDELNDYLDILDDSMASAEDKSAARQSIKELLA